MADGAGPKIGDARSLWNFTPSPGWTKEECLALRQCLKKFGVGKWVQIVDSGVLPGKQIQQLNGQTQRLLGKQSLAEYSGLKLDIDAIRNDNDALEGCVRKNGLITNQGGIRSKDELNKLREENLKKYGLSPEEVEAIELPEPPRAAALGSATYMGKNHHRGGIAGIDSMTTIKADMMTLSIDTLSKAQKITLLKALRRRVDGLRTQLIDTPAKAATPNKEPPAKRTKATTPASGKKKGKKTKTDDAGVASLMAMGFSKRHCQDALAACDGDMEESVEWLMLNVSGN